MLLLGLLYCFNSKVFMSGSSTTYPLDAREDYLRLSGVTF
jgi:hypothetical protein